MLLVFCCTSDTESSLSLAVTSDSAPTTSDGKFWSLAATVSFSLMLPLMTLRLLLPKVTVSFSSLLPLMMPTASFCLLLLIVTVNFGLLCHYD